MTPPPGTPSDWVSGERVFAPPRGTVDVDWLVPAVVELAPGCSPAQARAALEAAWRRRRGADESAAGTGAAPGPDSHGPVHVAAERVLTEALESFGC